jgi:hypothetical protein
VTIRWDFIPPEPDSDGNQKFEAPYAVWDYLDMALVRPRPSFVISPSMRLSVQLGAGRKKIDAPGWSNLDYPEWDAESWKIGEFNNWRLPFGDGDVEEVVSFHTLDHLTPESVVRTLAEIQRVLCRGGTFTNVVPHGDSQLAKECIMHKSRFMIDTFRNIFSERQYDHRADMGEAPVPWAFDINVNFIYGITERNMVLFTQLVRR